MNPSLASTITQAASKQTYYTIRFLVDSNRVEDAYRAYAYFRWVDDILDSTPSPGRKLSQAETFGRRDFLLRQKALLENCLRGKAPEDPTSQENLLVELLQNDPHKTSGLRSYLHHMMLVMEFDEKRRGKIISQAELDQYTGWLAVAVSECMHYFLGSGSYAPQTGARYLAVSAAHITHMLRDTFIDAQAGYFNIPREVLESGGIGPLDVHSQAYQAWVKSRVQLARKYFEAGRRYYQSVQCWRHRLAACAYMARFEWLLAILEREDFQIRREYCERKNLRTGIKMSWSTLSNVFS